MPKKTKTFPHAPSSFVVPKLENFYNRAKRIKTKKSREDVLGYLLTDLSAASRPDGETIAQARKRVKKLKSQASKGGLGEGKKRKRQVSQDIALNAHRWSVAVGGKDGRPAKICTKLNCTQPALKVSEKCRWHCDPMEKSRWHANLRAEGVPPATKLSLRYRLTRTAIFTGLVPKDLTNTPLFAKTFDGAHRDVRVPGQSLNYADWCAARTYRAACKSLLWEICVAWLLMEQGDPEGNMKWALCVKKARELKIY